MNKNRSLNTLTSLVLISCFSLSAFLYLGFKNFNSFLMAWGKDLQMTVYLKEDVEDAELQRLLSLIQENKSVQSVQKVTPEENFEYFKNQMGNMFPQVNSAQEIKGLVPATLQILFNLKGHLEEPLKVFSNLAEKIKTEAAVEEVSYGQLWVEKFSNFFVLIRQGFWIISLVLILASLFVFSNAVRAWVHSKRVEIEVMELVGATSWKIRKPFMLKGLILGLLTGTTGLLLVVGLGSYLKEFLLQQELLSGLAQRMVGFSIAESVVFVLMAASLGVLSAYLCVKEINSGWAASEGN